MDDDNRKRRDERGFLRRYFPKRPVTREEGRISVDADEYVRAHPQAATLTVNGSTISLSPDASQLAKMSVPVSRPGPFSIRMTVAAADGGVLWKEKMRIPYPVLPGFHMTSRRYGVANAQVTITARGTMEVRFPRKT